MPMSVGSRRFQRTWRATLAVTFALTLSGFSSATSADSDGTASALERARSAISKERNEKAISILTGIEDEHCTECKTLLARSYAGAQRYDEAVETYRALLAALPQAAKPIGIYSELGSSLFNLAYLPSRDEYREAIRLHEAIGPADGFDPGWIEVWDERRIRYLNESRIAFETALELSGGDSESLRIGLAEVHFRLGQQAEVRQLLDPLEGSETVSAKAAELLQCVAAFSDAEATPPPAEEPPDTITPPIRKNASKRSAMPQYTADARKAKIEGEVELELQIGKDGKAHCVRILRSLPLLDLAAYQTVSKWEWEPATLNGEPVPALYFTTVTFRLGY